MDFCFFSHFPPSSCVHYSFLWQNLFGWSNAIGSSYLSMTWIALNQRIFIFRKRREKWLLPHLGKMNQEVGRRALQWKTWSIYLQFNPHLLLTDRISLSDWHSGLQKSGTFSLLLESFSSATSLKLLGVFKSWCRCLDHTRTLRSKVFFEETSRALKMKLMELKCRVAYSWIEFYRKGNWSDALCVNNSFSNDVSYLFFFTSSSFWLIVRPIYH